MDKTWVRIPNKPKAHGWAFFYYLKRQGDNPRATVYGDGSVTVRVRT